VLGIVSAQPVLGDSSVGAWEEQDVWR
jgi:hypothetical protein